MGAVFTFFDLIEPKMEGFFGIVGMLLLAIMFIFIPVCFLIVNWEQLKSCFKKITDETFGTSGHHEIGRRQ